MVRSLSFIHLFVILSIGYIGGALLFREIPPEAPEIWIRLLDPRIVNSDEGTLLKPILTAILFFLTAFGLSFNNKTRHAILFIGAIKCVIFGLSSSYLLASGTSLLVYTVWWFPFQLLGCLLFLVYCTVLSPPYFNRISRRRRNVRAVPVLLAAYTIILLVDMTVFRLLVN